MDFCSPEVWLAIGENLLAAIVFTGLVYFFQHGRYFFYLRMRYHKKDFEIYEKESDTPVRRATCTVSGNVIKYEGEHLESHPSGNQGKFEGEFIMNPINLRVGTGLHVHVGYHGFNFPKIIIKNTSTFYVESHYFSKKMYDKAGSESKERKDHFDIFYLAYIWKKNHNQNIA